MSENQWWELQDFNGLIPLTATPPVFEPFEVTRLFNDAHAVSTGVGVVCNLLRNSATAASNSGETALNAATLDGLLQLVEVASRQLAREIESMAFKREGQ